MKIVQLCPYAMDRPGGVQRHVRDLAAWLNANGHDCRIVAPPAPGRRAKQDAPLFEIGRAKALAVHGTAFELSLAAPWAVRRLARALRDWGAEVVHMHTPWTPLVVSQMADALRLPRVTTIHATLPDPEGAGLIDRYIHRNAAGHLARSARVVVPSPAPLDMLGRLVPGCAPQILPPAVDLSQMLNAQAERVPMRCVFLGRLEPRKGLDLLLAAWPGIAAALPEAELVVIGDGPLRAALDGLPQSRALGRLGDAEVAQHLAQADMFLAPAPYGESYGLVLAEAMAAGAVPVAAANPGYAHVLRDLPELLVPPGDAGALAAHVIALAGQDRAPLRDPIRAVARQSHMGPETGARFVALYVSALSVA